MFEGQIKQEPLGDPFTCYDASVGARFAQLFTNSDMATISPAESAAGGRHHGTAQDAEAFGDDSESPLLNLGFLKNLTEKKTTRDGQPPKRRGPKPDSKPALTRRQELNRQAQRTHRERKELYIKALEQEVRRLKETYMNVTHERDAVREENRRLKELLQQHGIPFQGLPSSDTSGRADQSWDFISSSGSISGSYNTPGTGSQRYSPAPGPGNYVNPAPNQQPGAVYQQQGTDYDQTGIDFVLTLERPCMDHMQFLLVRAQDSEGDISGHALMASAPPESHIIEHPDQAYMKKPHDFQPPDLMNLLDLSRRLNFDGEITPVMAWGMLLEHPRFRELTAADFDKLKEDLLAKVRCYGFGACLEEFEVRDALQSVFMNKGETFGSFN
ncbi:MAG: hypothetical protein M1824_000564 [Vezdaea acicularis]|nr:MAG: hypothetical protein M1824_000564 [Vezdaea acicularis]